MSASDVASLNNQKDADVRRKAGEFVRGVSAAKHMIPCEEYPVEAGRYHLYVAFNCPWCHRVALARALLGLEDVISMDVAMPVRSEETHPEGEGKWVFQPEGVMARNKRHVQYDMCTPDTVNGKGTAVEIYRLAGHPTEKVRFGPCIPPSPFELPETKPALEVSPDALRQADTHGGEQ